MRTENADVVLGVAEDEVDVDAVCTAPDVPVAAVDDDDDDAATLLVDGNVFVAESERYRMQSFSKRNIEREREKRNKLTNRFDGGGGST